MPHPVYTLEGVDMNGLIIRNNFLPDVPVWVLNGHGVNKKKIEIANNVISEGQRNDTLFKLACSLIAKMFLTTQH